MKRTLLATLFVFAFAALAISPNQVLAEKKVILKIPSAFPILNDVSLGEGPLFFKKGVEAASNGSIIVKIYEPGKLVPPFQIHEAVSSGKVNAGYTGPAYLAGKIPAAVFFSTFPFGPPPELFMGWFYRGNGMKLYQEMYDKAGYNFKGFPLTFMGPETSGWFKKPIKSPEDFKGLTVRFAGLAGKVMRKLGCSVSNIPGSEVFSSLEKGAIDGTEYGPPAVDRLLHFYKIVKYNYFPGWHQPSSMEELIINKKTWNSMSKTQQSIIELAAYAANTHTLAMTTTNQAKIVKKNAENYGVKNIKWSDEMLGLFYKTWLEVVKEESAKDPGFKKVWDDIQAFAAEQATWQSMGYLPRVMNK